MSRADDTYAQVLALHDSVQPPKYILEAEVCTIGRHTSCHIVVQQNVVSRVHAKIERSGPRYLLSDGGSVNGTFVNGHRLQGTHLLKDDDGIGLGSITPLLRFLDPDPTLMTVGRLRYEERAMMFYLGQQQVTLPHAQF